MISTSSISGGRSISGGLLLVEQAASVASCRVETTVRLCWWARSVISTSSISGGGLDQRLGGARSISSEAFSISGVPLK
ncbi:Uncharacterised protein [Mycobacteroides abscessus subsp. abscessus]|uniref:Secreted protein n=1 Tax=Gordonia jacobaea TaxID=122202 RepID=A0ABR5I9T4_9ACTN|nr:hypothetical protein ABW18_16165 [Gordonia jacobaea]SKZ48928.1 Uncharacterised protein [Mycobacteroides abscessus subsp. abscessus]